MKKIKLRTEGYASNCYLLVSGTEAAIIDPSAKLSDIESALSNENATLKYILLTHGHYDHVLYLQGVRDRFEAPVLIHEGDGAFLLNTKLSLFHLIGKSTVFSPAEILLSGGEVLELGDERITVIHTPGHTAGSVCYICDNDIFCGDTLFDMSVGRCDLPTGDVDMLSESVMMLTGKYPDSVIHPGHGDSATMKKQIEFNPYTKGML